MPHAPRPESALSLVHGKYRAFAQVLEERAATRVIGTRRERESHREYSIVHVNIVRGWLALYLRMATEWALSTDASDTISGNRAAIVGKILDCRRALNHWSVLGIFFTQSPPSLYLPDLYSFEFIPSETARATTSSASCGSMSRFAVTRIKSSGNLNASAKSSGGTDPIEYERVATASAVNAAPSPQ
eukprot:CAMPEP_0195599528 /NCGR_PEP_ID=MMETSP0815-20121206/4080_1 /TAXON_ID=97485 /ORGANISM="Prymnesium parvum, Strain Texoma1" /LENGTH=186 /DNA_ID=CAMNT_0040738969 /DNA_START=730 /DNA_END=1291 /DNA_ORIENTATION=+